MDFSQDEPANTLATAEPDPASEDEAEGLRALDAFVSVGVYRLLTILLEEATGVIETRWEDCASFRDRLPARLARNAEGGHSLIVRFFDPELIQVDDCDEAIRARLAPLAFLSFATSPTRYQVWLCLTNAARHRALRKRLFARLAPTGANGIPCGSTRWPGSLNCKPKYRDAGGSFPRVRIVSIAPGRRVSPRELEDADLLAPHGRVHFRPALRGALARLAGRGGLTRAGAFWNRKKVIILQYGGVTGNPEYPLHLEETGQVRAAQFEVQMDYLARYRRVLPLQSYLQALRDGRPLPDYSAVLTFDEGYRNQLSAAAPQLLRRGLPATMFVVPQRLRDEPERDERWTPSDDFRFLSWRDVETLQRQGFEIGMNLVSRSRFPAYSGESAKRALARGYRMLAARTGVGSPPLALRWNEYHPELVALARDLGFSCALRASSLGLNTGRRDLFALERLIFDRRSHQDLQMFAADVTGLKGWWPLLAWRAEAPG